MNLSLQDTNNNNSKGVSFTSGFFMLLGFALLGLVVSSVISIGLITSVAGGKIEEALKDPANADLIRTIQVSSMVISMFIPALAVAFLLNRKPFKLLGFRSNINVSQVILVVALMFFALFVAGAFGVMNKEIADSFGLKGWSEKLEKSYNEQVAIMLDMHSIGGYFISLFVMAFVPAVCEEMLFRGGLQNFLSRATKKPWLALVLVSILFSIVHFSAYAFLVRIFLGLMLGLIYHYTHNIWLCILAHFFNNALAVSSVYFLMQQGKGMEEAMSKEISAAYWGFLALPLIFVLFKSLRKVSVNENLPVESNQEIKY
ncbi:MAG: CPBP family glutamic-type intramembrane protease [Flavisolibacter sp.]